MTISDRLKEASSEVKHGPVRQQIEEVFAVMGGSRAWQDQNRNHADLIDSLFEKHAKLIEELQAKVDHLAEPLFRNLAKQVKAMDADLKLIDAQLRILTSAWEPFAQAYPKHIADTERKISDLADRLSVVHVQAQGDAKVRELAEKSAKSPARARICASERIEELKFVVDIVRGAHNPPHPSPRPVVYVDEVLRDIAARIFVLTSDIDSDTQPATMMREDAEQEEDDTPTVSDYVQQAHERLRDKHQALIAERKKARLDELDIIAKRLDRKTMPWIAQRLGYQPIPVGETLMNEIEKRRREIEEGT